MVRNAIQGLMAVHKSGLNKFSLHAFYRNKQTLCGTLTLLHAYLDVVLASSCS